MLGIFAKLTLALALTLGLTFAVLDDDDPPPKLAGERPPPPPRSPAESDGVPEPPTTWEPGLLTLPELPAVDPWESSPSTPALLDGGDLELAKITPA